MKKLTMNHLAFSAIRTNKKAYALLALSVFLAVFVAVSTMLGTLALIQIAADRRQAKYGSEDAFVFDAASVPTDVPGVRQLGTVILIGSVKNFPVGYYDETAQKILCRKCLEGRLPEKAGEAALNLTALERLQPGAKVGDTLVAPFTAGGKTEMKTYKIVGILQPQFSDDTRESFAEAVPASSLSMPEILVSPEEGGAVQNRHLVVIFSKGGTLETLRAAFPENSCLGIDWFGGPYEDEPVFGFWEQFRENMNISSALLLGGSCLFLGSLIGVLEATSGQFDRKRQQYTMYRTIGATRRQLTRISSREALVQAVVLSPVAVGASFLFVWVLCRIFPNSLHFVPDIRWAAISALGSLFLIWLAGRLPALFARIPTAVRPGPVLRFPPVRSRKRFDIGALWNARRFRFHPLRQLGCLVLTVILNLSIIASAEEVIYQLHSRKGMDEAFDTSAIFLERENMNWDGPIFSTLRTYHLGTDVLDELQGLPGVSSAEGTWFSKVIALTDHVGDDFEAVGMDNAQLYRNAARDYPQAFAQHQALQQALGTNQSTIELKLLVVSDLSALEDCVVSGRIDRDKVNSGAEILVSVPKYYVRYTENGKHLTSGPVGDYDAIENDQFTAGQTLPLVQLCLTEQQSKDVNNTTPAQELPFDQAQLLRAEPIVGAVVNGEAFYASCNVITTPDGLKNLGLICDSTYRIQVSFSDGLSQAQHEELSSALSRIAAREDDISIWDPLEDMQSMNGSGLRRSGFFCLISLGLLVLTELLLCGSILRQIRAERRTIGTLRAVGCDEKTLARLFSRQIPTTAVAAGILISAAIVLSALPYWQYNRALVLSRLICCIFTAVVLSGLCNCIVHAQIRRETDRSIVESIREE